MRTLTILHLVSLRGLGGRAATALRQAKLLAGRGHRVLAGCLPGSAVEARSRELGLEVFSAFRFRRGLRPLDFWRDCRLLAHICDSRKVDVLHAHLSQETWVSCAALSLAAHRPAFVRSRGVVVPVKPHLFNRLLHNRLSSCVVAPSDVISAQLRSTPGFDPAKVRLIPDGVDLSRFVPSRDNAAVRSEFKIRPEARLLVMVARLEPVKGHNVFFQALKKLAQNVQMPPIHALCACDERTAGVYAATVSAARALGLNDETLSFTGLRPDIEKLLAAADVVALPSLGSEGSSRVGLEAAACGVPVVASRVGCLPEVIAEGETGLLTPPGDAHALAEALLALLKDPQRARLMGEKARRRAEALYDEQLMVKNLEQLYLEMVDGRNK